MHFVTLLIFGYICLFLIPASIRNPKWFLAVWGVCVALVAFLFARHLARSKTADALAQMFAVSYTHLTLPTKRIV